MAGDAVALVALGLSIYKKSPRVFFNYAKGLMALFAARDPCRHHRRGRCVSAICQRDSWATGYSKPFRDGMYRRSLRSADHGGMIGLALCGPSGLVFRPSVGKSRHSLFIGDHRLAYFP